MTKQKPKMDASRNAISAVNNDKPKVKHVVPAPNANAILQYLSESGRIDLGDVEATMKKEHLENIVKSNHPYPIWFGGGRWKSYIYDETKPKKRRQISRNSYDDIIELLYSEYKDEIQDHTLRTLFPEWIEYKAKRIADNSITRLKSDWKRFYEDSKIVDVSLTDLTDLMIENWLLSILHIQPLTKTCYHNMVGIIKGELEYAARRRLITRSPYETVNLDLHNVLRVPEDKPDEKQVFAPEVVLEFESLALEDFNEAGRKVYRLAPLAALFAFYCGTRVGELTGLMHTDVTDKEIHIRRFVRREDHQVIERAKTKSGIRTIPLTAKGREILSLVDQYKQENGIPRNGFVFSEYDRPLPSRIVEEYFMKYCTKIRTPHKSTHCARKTYISTLVDANVNINTIRKAAGHADERTTYRNYVFDRSTPAEKMQKFEAALDYKNRMQPHATPAATNE